MLLSLVPSTVDDVAPMVASHARVRAHGARSKSALATVSPGVASIDMSRLSGIVEYDPGEYTFTALAGTPIAFVQQALAQHGQTLPFDPPFETAGATLGGTVAAGLSGSGRYRNGGVRDFILGARFVDGDGRLVKGGGKVVKNAAGFDLPKLMVGSLGWLGVIVELSFKVFPRPERYGTLRFNVPGLAEAVALIRRLGRSTWDLAALDVVVAEDGQVAVHVRLAGLAAALRDRLDRLRRELGHGDLCFDVEDEGVWREAREFSWRPADASLVKVPVTPGRIEAADEALATAGGSRRYVAGGQVAWLAWRDSIESLDTRLRAVGLSGLVVIGNPGGRSPLVGVADGGAFAQRVKQAIDPLDRFGERP